MLNESNMVSPQFFQPHTRAAAEKPGSGYVMHNAGGRTAGSVAVWGGSGDGVARTPQGEGEFSFLDVLDIVNPLQHIPLVSSIYREITGDSIRPASRILGGAIFGGPLGMASSAANVLVEAQTGKDIAENLLDMAQATARGPHQAANTAEAAARHTRSYNT